MSDMTDNTVTPAARRERHLVRRLYDWAFESAGTRRAVWVLAGLCYLQSLFLPLPPDLLLIPMVLAKRAKAWFFAGIATVSSVGGGLTGYMIGYFLYDWLGEPLLALSGHSGDLTTFYEYRDTWGAWFVAAGALTPLPYKLVAIASGAAQLDVGSFILASLVARGMRFYVEAGVLWYLGPRARRLIEHRYGAALVIGVAVLTLAVMVLIPFVT